MGQTYGVDQGWTKEEGTKGTQAVGGEEMKGQIPFLNVA